MLSVAVNIWLGNAAAVLCGRWGAVTRRAREVGYSRTAIYNHAQRVRGRFKILAEATPVS